VVITISTIETAPVEIAASEQPQAWEPDDNEDEGSFASILAGLTGTFNKTEADDLANIEKAENIDGIFDGGILSEEVLVSGFLEGGIDTEALSGEKAAYSNDKESFNTLKVIKNDAAEAAFPKENIDILLSAEHILARSGELDAEITEKSSFLEGFSGESAAGTASGKDSSLIDKAGKPDLHQLPFDTAGTIVAAQSEEAAASGKNQKKAAFKDRELSNTEALSSGSRKSDETAALRANGNKARVEETRSRDKRRDRLSFEVRDFRTGDAANNASKTAEMRLFAGVEPKMRVDGGFREITLELRLPDYNAGGMGQNSSAAETHWEVKAGTAFEDLLARELHQNFNGDIVRHASMALHDGGEGTIRLTLKPESLGNVKIHLEMAENKITGHIVVESEEALRAFQKEVHSLEQAFRDSGFADASLNLSLTADNQGAERQEQEAASFPPQIAASRYDDSFELAEASMTDVFFRQESLSVNVLV